MATAIARPAHRRQGSDVTALPLPMLGAATSTVTLDGRILEIHDNQQRGRKDDDGRGPTKMQAKGAVARPPPLPRTLSDRAPMTPPRISGVSLAPLPNLEHHHHHSFSGEKSPGASGAPKPLQRRPSLTHGVLGGKALPPHAALGAACGHACVAAAPAPAATVGASVAHGAASFSCGGGIGTSSQLIAEGRSIARSVTIDPWIVAYMDINGTDADSVCATPPPRLNMQSLARSDSNGAFGPLSPWPLSPSILTVCGQLGVDDHFADNGSLELVDMRTCQSPKLPPV